MPKYFKMLKNLAVSKNSHCLSTIIMDTVMKKNNTNVNNNANIKLPNSSTERYDGQTSMNLEKAEINSNNFDILILKYLKNNISNHIKDILRGMNIIQILVELLEVN